MYYETKIDEAAISPMFIYNIWCIIWLDDNYAIIIKNLQYDKNLLR